MISEGYEIGRVLQMLDWVNELLRLYLWWLSVEKVLIYEIPRKFEIKRLKLPGES